MVGLGVSLGGVASHLAVRNIKVGRRQPSLGPAVRPLGVFGRNLFFFEMY